MHPDAERLDRVRRQMSASGLDALLCRLPHNVLMLTGYAPVLGDSFVLFPFESDPVLLVPSSEEQLARQGWVRDVRPFTGPTLLRLATVHEAVEPLLAQLAHEKRLLGRVIGYECEYGPVPGSYTQLAVTSAGTAQLFQEAFGDATWRSADEDLEQLEATLTDREVDMVRLANLVAAEAIQMARRSVRPGVRECDLAATISKTALAAGYRLGPVKRVMPYPHVLSGPRTEMGCRPYSLTSGRKINRGDNVLVQLELYLDGFWAKVSRTFLVGEPTAEQRAAYQACLEAMQRALQVERAGIPASGVDIAARTVLTKRGYGDAFTHGLGHGVGFQPTSRNQPPRLHPASPDILKAGMVHTVEPAVYMENFGIRVGDNLLVTDGLPQQLTPLERELDWAICRGRWLVSAA